MRKGQAALEFLTTYGWAMLIILVMIGAISYFGILNPSKLLPARCQSSPEFNCQDYQITSDGKMKIVLQQSVGKTIYLNDMNCMHATAPGTTHEAASMSINGGTPFNGPANAPWSPRYTLEATCDFGADSTLASLKNQKVKILYNITYQTSSGGLIHTADGEVYAEVQ